MDTYEKKARNRMKLYEIAPSRKYIDYCNYLIPLYEKAVSLSAWKEVRTLREIARIMEEELAGKEKQTNNN